jgi:hypothetical protein
MRGLSQAPVGLNVQSGVPIACVYNIFYQRAPGAGFKAAPEVRFAGRVAFPGR